MKSLYNKWLAFWNGGEIGALRKEIIELRAMLHASQGANAVAYQQLTSLVEQIKPPASGGFLGRRSLSRMGEDVLSIRRSDPEMAAKIAAEFAKHSGTAVVNVPIGTGELTPEVQEFIRNSFPPRSSGYMDPASPYYVGPEPTPKE